MHKFIIVASNGERKISYILRAVFLFIFTKGIQNFTTAWFMLGKPRLFGYSKDSKMQGESLMYL